MTAFKILLSALLLVAGLPLAAVAQTYPHRAIKMILPFPPGSATDGVARYIAEELPYDPEKDFEPVGGIMRIPQLLVVKKDFPADDVAGFVKVAKERAGTKGLS
jgi:tripartite-type tricarboxylate transporter receptor subunit TctC